MTRTALPISEFLDRLEQTLLPTESLGGLRQLEHHVGRAFHDKLRGHVLLSTCTQTFALETLVATSTKQINEMTRVMPEVSIMFLDFVTTLRKLRAATLLTTHGYLGVGYGLLRDVKDNTIHLSAVFQRMITSLDLMGISPTHPPKATNEELKNLHRRHRIRTERKVMGDFIGASSGFSEDDIFELERWADLFDREVHGSFLSSSIFALDWVQGQEMLHFLHADESMEGMFANRYNEVSWMFHRLLPNLQIGETGFGQEWAEKWNILDESLWQMEHGLGAGQLGKKIADSFIRFIDLKFPFDASTRLT